VVYSRTSQILIFAFSALPFSNKAVAQDAEQIRLLEKCVGQNLVADIHHEEAPEKWLLDDMNKFFDANSMQSGHSPGVSTRLIPAVEVKMNPEDEFLVFSIKPQEYDQILIHPEVQKTLDQHVPGYRYSRSFGIFHEIISPDGVAFTLPSSYFDNLSSQPKEQLKEVCDHASAVVRSRPRIENPEAAVSLSAMGGEDWGMYQMEKALKVALTPFRSNLGHAKVDIFPIEKTEGGYRYSINTTVEEGPIITVYHDTMFLPANRTDLHATLIGIDHAQGLYRAARRGGPPISYDIPGINYQSVTERAGMPAPENIDELLDEGKRKQVDDLRQVLFKVYLAYAKIRGWSRDFISGLFQHSLDTMNNTPYAAVFEKSADGSPPKLVGNFGITQVGYGKVRFFNVPTQQWTEVTGATGGGLQTAFPDLYPGPYFNHNPANWHVPVPVLGVEEIPGHHRTLPRPAILKDVYFSTAMPHHYLGSTATIGPGLIADLSKGIFRYDGGPVSEPTKIWLEKGNTHREDVKAKIWSFFTDSTFPDWRSVHYNLNASRNYIYNDEDGWLDIYKPKGWEKVLTSRIFLYHLLC
jgi:hypothetical protein